MISTTDFYSHDNSLFTQLIFLYFSSNSLSLSRERESSLKNITLAYMYSTS